MRRSSGVLTRLGDEALAILRLLLLREGDNKTKMHSAEVLLRIRYQQGQQPARSPSLLGEIESGALDAVYRWSQRGKEDHDADEEDIEDEIDEEEDEDIEDDIDDDIDDEIEEAGARPTARTSKLGSIVLGTLIFITTLLGTTLFQQKSTFDSARRHCQLPTNNCQLLLPKDAQAGCAAIPTLLDGHFRCDADQGQEVHEERQTKPEGDTELVATDIPGDLHLHDLNFFGSFGLLTVLDTGFCRFGNDSLIDAEAHRQLHQQQHQEQTGQPCQQSKPNAPDTLHQGWHTHLTTIYQMMCPGQGHRDDQHQHVGEEPPTGMQSFLDRCFHFHLLFADRIDTHGSEDGLPSILRIGSIATGKGTAPLEKGQQQSKRQANRCEPLQGGGVQGKRFDVGIACQPRQGWRVQQL